MNSMQAAFSAFIGIRHHFTDNVYCNQLWRAESDNLAGSVCDECQVMLAYWSDCVNAMGSRHTVLAT